MSKTDPPEMTTAEVAAYLDKPVATVNRWAVNGTLTATRKLPGRTGSRLYARADVERLAAESAQAVAS